MLCSFFLFYFDPFHWLVVYVRWRCKHNLPVYRKEQSRRVRLVNRTLDPVNSHAGSHAFIQFVSFLDKSLAQTVRHNRVGLKSSILISFYPANIFYWRCSFFRSCYRFYCHLTVSLLISTFVANVKENIYVIQKYVFCLYPFIFKVFVEWWCSNRLERRNRCDFKFESADYQICPLGNWTEQKQLVNCKNRTVTNFVHWYEEVKIVLLVAKFVIEHNNKFICNSKWIPFHFGSEYLESCYSYIPLVDEPPFKIFFNANLVSHITHICG